MMSQAHDPYPTSSFAYLAEKEEQHWWFRARNRILLWVLATKVRPFKRLLEIGCGTGYVLRGIREAYPQVELHGSEYFEEGLSFARQRIPGANFRRIDAKEMEEIEAYDVIGAFDVLEHIDEDERVLKNLASAIKTDGSLVITVPQHPWLWSTLDDYAHHERRYTRQELVEKVSRAGLEVVYTTSFVSLLVPLMWLSRLRARREEYDVTSEFNIPVWLNKSLEAVMTVEIFLLKKGWRFPVGGSLLLVATKR